MNKETYLRLPNITVGELQDVVNYLEENNIKYVEYYENEHKLEQALDEIEKYIEEYQEERTYTDRGGFTCVDGHFLRDSDNLLEIIQKTKGDVKNENNNLFV